MDKQDTTTPLNRFFTFWWILGGFAVFGLLALAAYAIGGKHKDETYAARAEDRLAIKGRVMAEQGAILTEAKIDFAAAAAAMSSVKVTASEKAAPGTPTSIREMELVAAKMKAEAEEKAAAEAAANPDAAEAQKLTLNTTNPAKGEPIMQFAEKELTAVAGEPIAMTFNNVDTVLVTGHNVVICKPGTFDAVVAASLTEAANGYVPKTADVIAGSKLLLPNEIETLKFTIDEAGDYPYVCTFPGHSLLMKGMLKITAAK